MSSKEKKPGERKGKAAKPVTKTLKPKPVDLKPKPVAVDLKPKPVDQKKALDIIAAASQQRKPVTQGFVFKVSPLPGPPNSAKFRSRWQKSALVLAVLGSFSFIRPYLLLPFLFML